MIDITGGEDGNGKRRGRGGIGECSRGWRRNGSRAETGIEGAFDGLAATPPETHLGGLRLEQSCGNVVGYIDGVKVDVG